MMPVIRPQEHCYLEVPMPEGYPRTGLFMGKSPEYAIFRQFGALNAENLLYLQAELKVLETKLRKYQEADRDSEHEDRKIYSRDWETLESSCDATTTIGNDQNQWNTILAIREKLKEYNTALLQQHQIANLPHPNPRDLIFLRDWMSSTQMGNVFLIGKDSDIWSEDELDLIALKQRKGEDPFSAWIFDNIIQSFHLLIGHHFREPKNTGDASYLANLVTYSEESILRITRLVIIIVACLLPVLSVVILHIVDGLSKRLGIIGGLTATFSLCLGCLTGAKISEIFSATAAFVAVLVVFVGGSAVNGPMASSASRLESMAFLLNCTALVSKCAGVDYSNASLLL